MRARKEKFLMDGNLKLSSLPSSQFRAIIINASNSNSISVMLEPAFSTFERMRGLMFRKKPSSLLFVFDFPAKHAIHSFFVAFAFDAIYLGKEGQVVDVFYSIPPFSPLIAPKAESLYLLELPAGYAAKLGVKEGDKLQIKIKRG
jgi:uncharacterized membrane protein (UPF0127 family)